MVCSVPPQSSAHPVRKDTEANGCLNVEEEEEEEEERVEKEEDGVRLAVI